MALYHSTDGDGITLLHPDQAQMRRLIRSLEEPDNADQDHPDVSLTNNDSGYTISVYPGGVVTLENLNEPDEAIRFLREIQPEEALRLWIDLANGALSQLLALPWETEIDDSSTD